MPDPYRLSDGVYKTSAAVVHREEEYDSRGFELLRDMQSRHFWYRGRHRFLLHSVRRHLRRHASGRPAPSAVDLGGGAGGWVDYLLRDGTLPVSELALADSSEVALDLASRLLPGTVGRYRIDLLDLRWEDRWDVAFLLDVLEHIPDQERALGQVRSSLAPGGLLFVTVPALERFWTWNDEMARHQRRYCRADFARLAGACGFELLDARYFMFFLSPLLLASRLKAGPAAGRMSEGERLRLAEEMHRVPHPAVNAALASIFGIETPLGHVVPFPWGTSLLAVLQKPGRPATGPVGYQESDGTS